MNNSPSSTSTFSSHADSTGSCFVTAQGRPLTAEQHHVTQCGGTERPFSHPLYLEKREGIYGCVCCGRSLFLSSHKYESGTGWPSFFDVARDDAVREITDTSHGMVRTEVRCGACEAHLGHVFPDGPRPSGLRYCINGSALDFLPETSSCEGST